MNKSFSVFVCIIFMSFSLLIFDNASSQSVNQDDCPNIEGNSTNDRVGCLDSDGDGWSNSDENWTVNDGADAFENDKTQWKDLDKDGDRKISFDEFIDDDDMFSDVGSKTEFQELKDEFDRYDTDGDGYITYKELQDSIISGGETWAEEKPKVEGKPDNWWSDEDN